MSYTIKQTDGGLLAFDSQTGELVQIKRGAAPLACIERDPPETSAGFAADFYALPDADVSPALAAAINDLSAAAAVLFRELDKE